MKECQLRVDKEIMKHTVMLSKSLAMCLMISLCWEGWVWSSFLITTTLSATTVSAKACSAQTHSDWTGAGNTVTIYAPKRWFYHLCWRAAAPDRWGKCPSPQRCWWRTCRWPEWWLLQRPCPDSSHMSEVQNNKHTIKGKFKVKGSHQCRW